MEGTGQKRGGPGEREEGEMSLPLSPFRHQSRRFFLFFPSSDPLLTVLLHTDPSLSPLSFSAPLLLRREQPIYLGLCR